MEETISLQEIFETLKKRIVMIISITLLAVCASAAVSYFYLTPKYETSAQVLISRAATGSSILSAANPFDSDQRYISTYNVILKSPYILDQVSERMNGTVTRGQLNNQVSVSQEGNSQVVTIRVNSSNPAEAVEIANVTAEVFRQGVMDLLRIDNIHILAPAELYNSSSPVSPNPTLNMAIAFVVGLMAAVGIAFLLEFLDNTIRTEEDVEKQLGLPVLGAITVMDQEQKLVNDRQLYSSRLERFTKGSERVGS
ncbi:YveK family protein [Evansella sp. AB-rgal1]|uniref:YveK family protein n=1 Tax=Evansella sp. AB-rgal1 TaxID=3242696 RepID=UPI00359EB7D1